MAMRRSRSTAIAVLGVALAFATGGAAAVPKQAGSPGVRLVQIGSFTQPVYATAPPGDTRRSWSSSRAGDHGRP